MELSLEMAMVPINKEEEIVPTYDLFGISSIGIEMLGTPFINMVSIDFKSSLWVPKYTLLSLHHCRIPCGL
jgi:hypothetical protein